MFHNWLYMFAFFRKFVMLLVFVIWKSSFSLFELRYFFLSGFSFFWIKWGYVWLWAVFHTEIWDVLPFQVSVSMLECIQCGVWAGWPLFGFYGGGHLFSMSLWLVLHLLIYYWCYYPILFYTNFLCMNLLVFYWPFEGFFFFLSMVSFRDVLAAE